MSTMDNDPGRAGVKTLAIRLEPELHAQLSLVAQLRGKTITDEIRTAITAHIESLKAAPELADRANSVLEDIEHEAASRRAAIASMFEAAPEPTLESAPASRSRRRGTEGEVSS